MSISALTDISGLKFDLDATQESDSDAANVVTMHDRSGNGWNAAGGAGNVTMRTSGINGNRAYEFDGTTSYREMSGSGSSFDLAAYTIFWVGYFESVGEGVMGKNTSALSTDGRRKLQVGIHSHSSGNDGKTAAMRGGGVGRRVPIVFAIRVQGNGATVDFWINGQLQAYTSQTLVTNTYNSVNVVIGRAFQNTGAEYFGGRTGRLAMYDSALTDGQVLDVNTFLGAQFSITLDWPLGFSPVEYTTAPSNLKTWIDASADSAPFSDGDRVTSFVDIAFGTLLWGGSTSNQRPTMELSEQNGLAALKLLASESRFALWLGAESQHDINAAWTIIAVVKGTTIGIWNKCDIAQGGNLRRQIITIPGCTQGLEDGTADAAIADSSPNTSTYHVVGWRCTTGPTVKQRRDTNAELTAVMDPNWNTTFNNAAVASLGRSFGNFSAEYNDLMVCHLIVINEYLGNTPFEALMDEVGNRFNIDTTVVAGGGAAAASMFF